MTEQTTQYPAWQESIRAAQVEIRQEIDAERQKELEKQSALDRRLGGLLEGALELFDIDVPEQPNPSSTITLDGFRFSISQYSKDDQDLPTLINDRGANAPRYQFTLEVAYAFEGKYAQKADDWENWTYQTVTVLHALENMDWTQERAQLADALDEVTAKGASFIKQVDQWEAHKDDPPTPSIGARLEALMRDIACEEINAHGDYDGYED